MHCCIPPDCCLPTQLVSSFLLFISFLSFFFLPSILPPSSFLFFTLCSLLLPQYQSTNAQLWSIINIQCTCLQRCTRSCRPYLARSPSASCYIPLRRTRNAIEMSCFACYLILGETHRSQERRLLRSYVLRWGVQWLRVLLFMSFKTFTQLKQN